MPRQHQMFVGPLQDSEELLRNLHLAPYAKPIVSLIDDFPMVQRHKGWQFGFLQGNATRKMTCALAALPLTSLLLSAQDSMDQKLM